MTESFENYLKTILILQKRNGQVLCADVAAELGYSRASVTIAVRKLREHGCLKSNSRLLVLTERGQQLAERTYERRSICANAGISWRG
ncbi:MAG: metal-dependent transcriptional regulator [Butyricicoccus sp.]